MKHTALLSLIALVLSGSAFAQNKKPKGVTAIEDTAQHATGTRPEISASFGFGTAGSKFHFGPGFHIEFPTRIDGKQLKFGGQTGFLFGPSSPTSWIIPIMASGTYMIPANSELKPYIGLAMGAGIFHFSVPDTTIPFFGTVVKGGSHTDVDFALLFKPGVKLGDGHKFFAELPFGTLGSEFAILPTVGYTF